MRIALFFAYFFGFAIGIPMLVLNLLDRVPAMQDHKVALFVGVLVWALLQFPIFPRVASWAGAAAPLPGTPALTLDDLRGRILALNDAGNPWVYRGGHEPDELIAEWRYADARWLDFRRAHKLSSVHRIALRLDEAGHRAWAAESESTSDRSGGLDGADLKWEMNWGITFYESKKETVYGFQWKDGKLTRDASYHYRFDLSELRQPLIATVTAAGWDYYPDLRISTLLRSLWPKAPLLSAAPGAQPPLEYQLKAAAAIVRCRVEVTALGTHYKMLESLKGEVPSAFVRDARLQINTRMFEQLGYRATAGQEVIVFLTDQPIELLPVVQDRIVYAAADAAVRRDLSIDQLKQLIGR
jgi:hypothetical protein